MMKKIALSIFTLLFPILAFASAFPGSASTSGGSPLSFAPPPSDVSVIFLGNIFGIVDGVLHGSGSQIMGQLFGVFNSAVLALGGIVIMYTLIVSTMNTAQEGEMLGKKWSSIWVPLRATLGLGLLIPKASGYCLMQIFVMWIIVQGIGAADKVWGAALSYLNRGGVIIQTQMNPKTSLISGGTSVATGASIILQGQVCMAGVQAALQNALQSYSSAKQSSGGASGPCVGSPEKKLKAFCDESSVPDFINTVNAVAIQNANPDNAGNYSVPMPNFNSNSLFASLNGICGTLVWSPFAASNMETIKNNISTLSQSELQTAQMSRAIAIQQMYMDLASVARTMVANNPGLRPQTNDNASGTKQPNFSAAAIQQFGVPYLSSGAPCTDVSDQCTRWGLDPNNNATALFNGTEFQGAITDYNGIMLPTLNLLQQAAAKTNANDQRKFIQKAVSQGWILAGSYFLNLSMLNASAINNANLTDSNTGLDSSTFEMAYLTRSFAGGGCNSGKYSELCIWLDKNALAINSITALLNGASMITPPVSPPSVSPTGHQAVANKGSSTVNGFINNSVMVTLPGQPGMKPPSFAMKFNLGVNLGQFKLQSQTFPCGEFGIWPLKFCLGSLLGNIFYNIIIKNLFNLFLSILAPFITVIIQSFLVAPLVGISQIFQQSVAIIQQPSVNPVIALANMGVNYINFANDLWILLIGLSATPLIGLLFPVLALIFPLLISWLGVMVSIGFICAYYIPFLPYMIFTFGSIAWLIAVIEAMVAAPIVALGVTHPEGHDAFGKGETAIMILMNVFLRPAMMIIGFIGAIGLSYVSVWVINAGFANAAAFIQGTATGLQLNYDAQNTLNQSGAERAAAIANNFDSMKTGYSSWAGIYGFFFSVVTYTTMYLVVVQKSFTLITYLPDKVLRWISGGQAEGLGEQAAQWAEGDVKRKLEDQGGAIDKTQEAGRARDQQTSGYAEKGLSKLKGGGGGGSQVGGS